MVLAGNCSLGGWPLIIWGGVENNFLYSGDPPFRYSFGGGAGSQTLFLRKIRKNLCVCFSSHSIAYMIVDPFSKTGLFITRVSSVCPMHVGRTREGGHGAWTPRLPCMQYSVAGWCSGSAAVVNTQATAWLLHEPADRDHSPWGGVWAERCLTGNNLIYYLACLSISRVNAILVSTLPV